MTGKLDVVVGSTNIFRDLGFENPDLELCKVKLAISIKRALDRDQLSVREAHKRTGVPAADFSRIRNSDLHRFTLDRLFTILAKLDSRITISLKISGRRRKMPGTATNLTLGGKPPMIDKSTSGRSQS